jgi:pimeloyl-ACP methyl ester carboxylesterase
MPANNFKAFLSKQKMLTYLIALLATYLLFSPYVMGPIYNRLLFFPDRNYHPEVNQRLQKMQDQYAAVLQEVFIPVSDNIKIHAWYFKKSDADKTLLISHGNGANICYRLPLVEALLKFGSVLIYDYEGYGKSAGTPSRPAICADGIAAYDYLTREHAIKPANIILYGESLGCGVSCEISKLRHVGGIILQSGWASLLSAARDRMVLPRLYPDWSFGKPYMDNMAVLNKPHPPVLLIHGELDNILPCRYSRMLFAKACEPKKLVLLPHASHNDILEADHFLYLQSISDFMKSL